LEVWEVWRLEVGGWRFGGLEVGGILSQPGWDLNPSLVWRIPAWYRKHGLLTGNRFVNKKGHPMRMAF